MSTSQLRLHPQVLSARQLLSDGREKLRQQFESGSPGIQLGFYIADLFDKVVLAILDAAVSEQPQRDRLRDGIALVAHSGYGRRDNAPYSDVDLMLLHSNAVTNLIPGLASRLVQDLSDVGVDLGFSVRTPRQACQLSMADPIIGTALIESRFLAGNEQLFQKFFERFRRVFSKRHTNSLIKAIEASRREERTKYGDTVYLLEPNIKRSRGGLRDIHLLRWIGFASYGESLPRNLKQMGKLSPSDHARLRDARDFLLLLRHSLHLQAGGAQDVLLKTEQLRIAEQRGYEGDEGVLPVERFMQEYFRHTTAVRHVVSHFVATAKWNSPIRMALHNLMGKTVDTDYLVGPRFISAKESGYDRVRGDLVEVLRLMDLSNRHAKRIDHQLWEVMRESMLQSNIEHVSPKAAGFFLSLLSETGRLGQLLRRLHELYVLEKLVPGWDHARCLLQFNDYHKYTVDEHSLRAVEEATKFGDSDGEIGRVYRKIQPKSTLHLALLIHDLGKGFAEDHSEVGRRIAKTVAKHLSMSQRESDRLVFLVHRHLMLNHLAFRRDNSDQAILLEVAKEIGSPTNLRMLYVLTCADLAAVGPGVLNQWKLQVLTDLYLRLLDTLSGGGDDSDPRMNPQRDELRKAVPAGDDGGWYHRHIDVLPSAYLYGSDSKEVLTELGRLKDLAPGDVAAWGKYLPDREVSEYSIGAKTDVVDGIFYRLAGALTSQGLEILSAEIHGLADSMFLDKFYVQDPDYAGLPPDRRFRAVEQKLRQALQVEVYEPPTFRQTFEAQKQTIAHQQPTQVRVDNSTSERFTVLDVFANDRPGLLYTIAKALHELGLSVQAARIGTYLDQVVDVFYVTDNNDKKVLDELYLDEIRSKLYHAIESGKSDET